MRKIKRRRVAGVMAMLAGVVLMGAPAPVQAWWTNLDTTWPPGPSQEWSIGSNWSAPSTPPVAGNSVRPLTAGLNQSILVNSTVTNLYLIYMNNGVRVYIGANGVVSNFTYTGKALAVGEPWGTPVSSNAYLYVAPGGRVHLSPVVIDYGSTAETEGTWTGNRIDIYKEGILKITGGTMTLTNSIDLYNGTVLQSGGAVATPALNIKALSSNTVYEISGGSINANHAQALCTSYGGAMAGPFTFRVIGAGATGISFTGLRYAQAADPGYTTWAFVLDRVAPHITKVNITTSNYSGPVLRTGSNLDVSLRGGVLLSGTNTFTLIQRISGTDTAWGTGPGALWTDSTTGNKSAIRVTLAGAADKGSLDCSLNTSTSFTATAYGYLDLTNVDTGKPLEIALELGAGTLGDLTAALDDAGIAWRTSRPGADIVLTLDSSVSGDKYFAWDLSSIAGDLTIKRVWSGEPPPRGTMISFF